MDIHIFREKYRIRSAEIDQNQHVTIPSMLQLMQEASLQHTIKLKVSYWDLLAQNISWVLLRKDLRIIKAAALNDVVEVLTCPTKFDRYFAQRDYRCVDQNGECIAFATSSWALIDINSRKMVPMLSRVRKWQCENLNDEQPCDFRLKNESGMESCQRYQVSNFDLDWNQHINNSVLTKYMLSAIPNKGINRVQLKFISEATLGDELIISKKNDDHSLLLEAYNHTKGQTVALAKVYLESS